MSIQQSKHWQLGSYLMAVLTVSLAAIAAKHVFAAPVQDANATVLRTAASFASIKNPSDRSRAMFLEAGKVIMHSRCMNCHPSGDTPSQGDAFEPHLPAVVRGKDGHGAIGLRCNTCHQVENYDVSKVPGNPAWGLAPLEMAWQGHTLAQICEQIKDPKRNGGKTLPQIHEHMAHDTLVGWAWNPGASRKPAPGTQAQFGELIQGWIEGGAECPKK